MPFLITLIAILIPPTIAYSGKGNRRMWAWMMIVGLFVAVIAYTQLDMNLRDAVLAQRGMSDKPLETAASFFGGLFLVAGGFTIGSLLAVCFYKASPPVFTECVVDPVPKVSRAEEPDMEDKNLIYWKESGRPHIWVEAHQGIWTHQEWLTLLEELKKSEFWPMEPDAIARVIEDLRKAWSESHTTPKEQTTDDQPMAINQHMEKPLKQLDTNEEEPSPAKPMPGKPQESPSARWARELKEKKDYLSLARSITETGLYDQRETQDKRYAADSVLRSAGSEAVEAILTVLDEAEQGWLGGKDYLARMLCDIGDPRAIPLLKTLLNRGRFSTSGDMQTQVRQFVGSHPKLWLQDEIASCLRCEKEFPVSQTEYYGDSSGREWRLCSDCWGCRVEWMIKLDQKDCSSLVFSHRRQAPPISLPKIVSPSEAAQHVNSQEQPAQPAPTQKTCALSADAKETINKLVQKAIDCWGGNPVWLGRAAVVLAEAGNQAKSAELLERALKLIRNQQDPISAQFDGAEVAGFFGSAASAAGDPQMFQRGLDLMGQINLIGLRAIILAHVFGYLYRTGDHSHAASVKERFLSDIDRLNGFDYSQAAIGAVETLVKNPSARDEATKLLETALTRGKSDKTYGQTILRDVSAAYVKAATDLGDSKLIEHAMDIAKQIDGVKGRAYVYREAAAAYAELGLQDDARTYLNRERDEVETLTDKRHRRDAERDLVTASVLAGVFCNDSALVQDGLALAEGIENKDIALLLVVGALVDAAMRKNDPHIVDKAGEIAERCEKPFNRKFRLADRVGVLFRSGHMERLEEAKERIARALADVESVSDSIERGSAYLSIAEAVLQASGTTRCALTT